MEMLPGSGHRDVEEPALLLDLFLATDRHIRRDAAVDHVQNEHSVPFLPFGGMDR